MAKFGGKKAWIAAGVAVLVGLAMVPALSGALAASSAARVAADPLSTPCVSPTTVPPMPTTHSADTQWSYGGVGYINYSFSFDSTNVTYNATFGWSVVFTVTQTSYGNWSLEEDRNVGVTIVKNVTNPKFSVLYCLHSAEHDAAFANITNQSTVYVNETPVQALGIVNASVSLSGLLDQTLNITNATGQYNASLSVMTSVQASVSFSPSLGLVPLNLTGVRCWNSSSTATYGANWDLSLAYTELNGSSGSYSKTGSLSGTAPVNLTGFQYGARHGFSDHKHRRGVILFIQGPFNGYDGFVLVPRAVDPFGGGARPFDAYRFGSAGISAEELYVSAGPGGLAFTAADQTFASADSVGFLAGPMGAGAAPSATGAPGMTVYGQPISTSQAVAIDHGITSGGGSAGSAGVGSKVSSSDLIAGAMVAAVAVVAVLVGVLGWRTFARRP